MNIFLALILSALIAYSLGSLNFAIIFFFLFKKQDIRLHGSKNAGMTNMIRVYGYLLGIPVLLCDFFKAVIAIYLCNFLFLNIEKYSLYGSLITGLFVIIGHLYPLYFNFKGGKGVASSAGVIFTQDIRLFVFVISVFLIVLFIKRIVAVASVSAAISYPISTLIFFKDYLSVVFSLMIAGLVIYSHKSNIKKLMKKQ